MGFLILSFRMGQAYHPPKTGLGKVSPTGGETLQVNLSHGSEQGVPKEITGMEDVYLHIPGSSQTQYQNKHCPSHPEEEEVSARGRGITLVDINSCARKHQAVGLRLPLQQV